MIYVTEVEQQSSEDEIRVDENGELEDLFGNCTIPDATLQHQGGVSGPSSGKSE